MRSLFRNRFPAGRPRESGTDFAVMGVTVRSYEPKLR